MLPVQVQNFLFRIPSIFVERMVRTSVDGKIGCNEKYSATYWRCRYWGEKDETDKRISDLEQRLHQAAVELQKQTNKATSLKREMDDQAKELLAVRKNQKLVWEYRKIFAMEVAALILLIYFYVF
ncbi:unnamed protein product [Amoebophrya sp. A25]|nr:unnamed protein product [Amoebophrya sp. A25]|eukprot:GSA25T00024581001.1